MTMNMVDFEAGRIFRLMGASEADGQTVDLCAQGAVPAHSALLAGAEHAHVRPRDPTLRGRHGRSVARVKGPPRLISRDAVREEALAFLARDPERWWPVSDVVDHVAHGCENSRDSIVEDLRQLTADGRIAVRQLPERKPHPRTRYLYRTEWRFGGEKP